MYQLLAAIAIGGMVVALFTYLTMRKYRALFAIEHVVETAERFQSALLAQMPAMVAQPTEINQLPGGITITSQGLCIVYTVEQEQGMFRHHLSLSYRNGMMAIRAATFFLAEFVELFQLHDIQKSYLRSETGVFHMHMSLEPERHEELLNRPLLLPEISNVASWKAKIFQDATAIQFTVTPHTGDEFAGA
jgi:hypothetical protein